MDELYKKPECLQQRISRFADSDHRRAITAHMILFAPRSRSAYIICKFFHVHQRAMDMTMQTKFVAGRNYFLWDFRIPFRNFANEINAGFGITQLLKDGINRP